MKTVFKTQATLVVSLLFFAVPVLAGKHVHERGTPAQAKEMAAQVIALFDREGAKVAFARFNERPAPDFKHLDLYIFVAEGRGCGHPCTRCGPIARRHRRRHAC